MDEWISSQPLFLKTAEVIGSVMIAGEKREITFSANFAIKEGSKIAASGRMSMDMRDYTYDPPTALLGIIRMNEEIDLAFELYFVSKD